MLSLGGTTIKKNLGARVGETVKRITAPPHKTIIYIVGMKVDNTYYII